MIVKRIIIVHTGAGGKTDLISKKEFKKVIKKSLNSLNKYDNKNLIKNFNDNPDNDNHLDRFIIISKILEDSEFTNTGFGSNICNDGSVRCDSSVLHIKNNSNFNLNIDTEIGACIYNSSRYPMKDAVKILINQRRESKIKGVIKPIVKIGELNNDQSLISPIMELIFQNKEKYENENGNNNNNNNNKINSGIQDTIGVILYEIDNENNYHVSIGSSSGGNLLRDPKRVGSAGIIGSGCWMEINKGNGDIICIMVSGQGEEIIRNCIARKLSEIISNEINENPDDYNPVQILLDFIKLNKLQSVGIVGVVFNQLNGDQQLFYAHTTETFIFGSNNSTATDIKIKTSKNVCGGAVTCGGWRL